MSLCPDCSAKMSVEKTTTASKITIRVEECPAGHRWETESVVVSTRRLPAAIRKGTRPVAGNQGQPVAGDRQLPATPEAVDKSCRQPGATGVQLPATAHSPPAVAGNPPATGAGGVRGGPSPIRGSVRDPGLGIRKGGDPDPDRARADAPAAAPAAVAASDPDRLPATAPPRRREDPKHPRTAEGLLALFGRRWEAHERKLWLKARFDDRDAVDLVESIREIPDEDDRERAFEEVIVAVETYLRIDKPFYAGHPFATFVKELPALRVGDAAALDRLRRGKAAWEAAERKHQRAANGTRSSSDPAPPPIADVPPPRDLTPEQRADLEAHRAQLSARKQVAAAAADKRAAEAIRRLEQRAKTNTGG